MSTADEPIETTIARIDAFADFAMGRACDECDAQVEPLATTHGMLQAVGVTHDPWCSEYVSW